MTDQRGLTFGVQWAIDTAPLDDTQQKQEQIQDESQRTADALEQIGTSIQGIGTRAETAFSGVSNASTGMGTAVRSALLGSIRQGDSLGKTLRAGLGAALDNAAAKAKGLGAGAKSVFSDITNAIRHPVQAIKATLGTALQDAENDAKGLGDQAGKSGDDLDEMGRRGGSAADTLGSKFASAIKTIAGLAIIKKGIDLLKDFVGSAIDAAANAEETQSKFDTVFGSAATGAETWIDNFSSSAKRSKEEIKGFMADSQAMMKGLGMAKEAGAEMSKSITSLAYDLGSFHNISDEDAFAKIRSGLMGETEGLKSLGIVMNEAAIQQSMLSMGYQGNASELRKQFSELDEATKAQLRFNVIVSQSGDALTDVTRTAGSYTNGLKGVKGMWQDFIAGAGAKFTPVLTELFNTILSAWPTIELMLMQFVDVLANGFAEGGPILMELGMTLLPVLSDALSMIFTVIQPLIPIISMVAQTVLPPLISVISLLAQTLLPPIMQILNVICMAILPPIAQLLGLIAPVLQAIAPILQVIGQVLGVIAEVVGTIIGWIADAGSAVINWITGLFGGASDVADATGTIADNMGSIADQAGTELPEMEIPTVDVPAIEIPPVELQTADAQAGMAEIGTTSADMYKDITQDSTDAWDAMGSAAKTGADGIILQFNRIRDAADSIGTVSIQTSVSGVGATIPRNARGTDDHPGGWTWINDGPRSGELAYLPGGTAIVPAEKAEQLITRGGGKVLHFAPNVNISLSGSASEADKAEIDERVRRVIRDEYERLRAEEAEQEAIQEGIA
uniref:Minor tail protein n=1 Tax=Siphoviridae sp. ct3lF2 TaxID=2825324 RepID=A0A8S5PQ96_9CAUD|nr:MAG TPA: minor tail protein [Siphoviridae sp. ct3lF2]